MRERMAVSLMIVVSATAQAVADEPERVAKAFGPKAAKLLIDGDLDGFAKLTAVPFYNGSECTLKDRDAIKDLIKKEISGGRFKDKEVPRAKAEVYSKFRVYLDDTERRHIDKIVKLVPCPG